MKINSFTSTDQLDKDGKKIDTIFKISQKEEFETFRILSGTEVKQEIKKLEKQIDDLNKELSKVQDELNFYNTLK